MKKKNVITGIGMFLLVSISYLIYSLTYEKSLTNYPTEEDLFNDVVLEVKDDLGYITIDGEKLNENYKRENVKITNIKEKIEGRNKEFTGDFSYIFGDITLEDRFDISYRNDGRKYILTSGYLDNESKRAIYITTCKEEYADMVQKEYRKRYNDILSMKLDKVEREEVDKKFYDYHACIYTFTATREGIDGLKHYDKEKVKYYIDCDYDNNCKSVVW